MSALSSAAKRAGVAIAAVTTALGAVSPAAAQAPEPPPYFAITNARIVTGTGSTIDRGTVVMRDGLITALGSNVQVPAGAWVIDGVGMTVYPGLVDAMSSVTLAADLRRPRGGGGGGGPGGGGGGQGQGQSSANHSWGPEDRPGTFTWVSAADDPNPGDDAVSTWRAAGFTTAVVSPERGFFSGQAAVLNLAGERGRNLVVATPVAQRVNFESGPGFPGYPGALFGAISYVKQVFFDAAQYERAWTLYERAPAGRERPTFDRTLEPLRYTLRANQPVLYPGNTDREMRRVFDIAAATNTVPIIYGGQEGYRLASLLAERRATVLVNANWPARDEDDDPDADVALSTLRFRDRAPTTPAELQRAGVRFAFYSGGAEPAKLMGNLRKSITLGLSPAAALRALTLTPAEIFGVANRVGSLEVGKIANVVVTDGDLFGDSTKITMVFVDGRKFDPPTTDQMASGGRGGRMARTMRGGDSAQAAPPEVQPPVPMTHDRGPISTDRVVLIQNATVMTVANGTMENASVLIRDGKIAAVGTNVQAPRGATVVDASGKYVIPGIIDAHSHIAADAINEGSVAVSAMVGIQDVIDPDDISIYRALAGGVTTINILHGSANPIGGKNAVIKLRWGADAKGLLMDGAPPGIKFALGENTKRDRNPDRYPATRMGVQDVIRQAFIEAQQYQREWDAYNALNNRQKQNAIPPRRDLKHEALAEILRGERLVHAHSYRADEILQLIRLADEFGFRISTFQHVLEGYKVADEIAEHGAGASTFSDWWAYKVEAYDAIPYNAALMTERGVVSSINSDSGEEMRHLNQEAAKAMHWGGLDETAALKLVTLNPAIQLGVSDRVGSIEVGKDADLVIYSGHPLSVMGVVEKTYVDGQLFFDREHDRQLHEQLQQEKKALLDKELGRTERPRVTTDSEGV